MEFKEFHKWIYDRYKINLQAYKQQQLNRRITSLMNRMGIMSLDEYKRIIESDIEQREKFFDFITINVTEFFRNPSLFNELERVIKSEFVEKDKPLKIWSAACSTGCEPYSVAILLNEIGRGKTVRNKIIATDIDKEILKKAKLGIYEYNDIRNASETIVKKYFKKNEEKYVVDDSIKRAVEFKKHDLILDKYDGDYDLIICRNVVIYFTNEIKNEIFSKFYNSLNKGGLLFVGATESIYNYKEYGFEKVSTFIYKKV